ncbi:MAG: hypothetical protein GY792_34295 [Gammaproteobacteria bacterium]|nr:hypothetical protein [Gammaproteobacteria bacterium]
MKLTNTPAQAETAEVKVLVQGAPLHGTNGVMFDSDDRLYIASINGNEIVVMDSDTGKILERLGPDKGVIAPDDLAFGPDGSLYWTSLPIGEVGRLSPDGVKSGQKVARGVNPITFSDNGRLFVALDFLGDALYELDPDFVDPPRLIAENLGWLNGMDWGPDGFLYGPIWSKGQVVRVNVDAGTITTVADGLGVPAAVKFDSQSRLHVLDQRGEVWRVNTETGNKEVVARLTPGGDNLAFDSQDRLFVSHTQDGTIFEGLPDGTTRTVSPGGMIFPGGVAVLPRPDGESVFVADFWTLREFDGLTGEERQVERHWIGVPGSITAPFTVSADDDKLVVSSFLMGNKVQVWDPENHTLLEEYPDFVAPLNAIRFQGDLIVAELGTNSVVRASSADPAERVTLATGLGVPVGLAATDDDLWVSDAATGSVLQIVDNGEPLAEPALVVKDLASPEGLAVAPDGNLLVVEAGAGRLSSIDLKTGNVSIVAEGLEIGFPSEHPTWIFNGVAVGPSGAIYVTGDIANVLYRIEPGEGGK